MPTAGAATMARPKAKSKEVPSEPATASRATIINLKGSDEQAAWLESVHRKTHLAKSVIVRLALDLWADKNGHKSFPSSEDGER